MDTFDRWLLFIPAVVAIFTAINAAISYRQTSRREYVNNLEEELESQMAKYKTCSEDRDRLEETNLRLMRKLLGEQGDQQVKKGKEP